MSLRLAVSTEDLGTTLKNSIGIAASLEVAGVRLNTRTELNVLRSTDSAMRQTRLYVEERQMEVAGLYCPTRHALYDSEYLEPRIEVIRKSMQIAKKLKTKELLVRCGRIPDPDNSQPSATSRDNPAEPANPFTFAQPAAAKPSDANLYSTLCELLSDLASYGNHVGCVLNLVVSGYHPRLLQRLIGDVSTGPLKIVFDTGTAVMTGADVVQTYRDLYAQIGYVRARDALKDVDGAGTEVAVNEGVVDWIHLLPTLTEADYRGWICVERTGGDNRREDVRRGVSYLKSLLPEPAI